MIPTAAAALGSEAIKKVSAPSVKFGKASQSATNAKAWLNIAITIAVLIIVFVFFKKIMGAFNAVTDTVSGALESANLKDTKEETKAKKQVDETLQLLQNGNDIDNPFSPKYYKLVQSKLKKNQILRLTTQASVKSIAKQIWESIGIISDNEQQLESAINRMKYKAQVSQVAEYFQANYKRELLLWLNDKLDTTSQRVALNRIVNTVKKMPSGIETKK